MVSRCSVQRARRDSSRGITRGTTVGARLTANLSSCCGWVEGVRWARSRHREATTATPTNVVSISGRRRADAPRHLCAGGRTRGARRRRRAGAFSRARCRSDGCGGRQPAGPSCRAVCITEASQVKSKNMLRFDAPAIHCFIDGFHRELVFEPCGYFLLNS